MSVYVYGGRKCTENEGKEDKTITELVGRLSWPNDPRLKGCHKNTRLLDAVGNGDIERISKLLKLDASPNATCHLNCVSACHMAAMMDNESLSMLIAAGAQALGLMVLVEFHYISPLGQEDRDKLLFYWIFQNIMFMKIMAGKSYFFFLETWTNFIATILAMFLPAVISTFSPESELMRAVASPTRSGVLLTWLEMMFLLCKFPRWGFYVLMFGKVTAEVLKVSYKIVDETILNKVMRWLSIFAILKLKNSVMFVNAMIVNVPQWLARFSVVGARSVLIFFFSFEIKIIIALYGCLHTIILSTITPRK
ncbi:unnamed protein product [Arctia plantaginis]|uniref:Uncharacterized protein n=1 Tax=Arctia plantaginis TaxID=874455 RepID=A0A8S1ANJ7_ARCPL|nr:unnamed protein product [Arctia plantaginis]